jgi:hypothetical protein
MYELACGGSMRSRHKLARKDIGGMLDTVGNIGLTAAPMLGPAAPFALGAGILAKGIGSVINLFKQRKQKKETEEAERKTHAQANYMLDQQEFDSYNRRFNLQDGGDLEAVAEVEDDETLLRTAGGEPIVGSDRMTVAEMSKRISPQGLTLLASLQKEAADNKENNISFSVPTYKGKKHKSGGIEVNVDGVPLKGGELVADGGQTLDNMERTTLNDIKKSGGGIYIKPSKRGTFTAAAKKRGMGVQAFASKVLANKGNYSSAMVKKANFARNAAKWKKPDGGPIVNTPGFINDPKFYNPYYAASLEENFPGATNTSTLTRSMYDQYIKDPANAPENLQNIFGNPESRNRYAFEMNPDLQQFNRVDFNYKNIPENIINREAFVGMNPAIMGMSFSKTAPSIAGPKLADMQPGIPSTVAGYTPTPQGSSIANVGFKGLKTPKFRESRWSPGKSITRRKQLGGTLANVQKYMNPELDIPGLPQNYNQYQTLTGAETPEPKKGLNLNMSPELVGDIGKGGLYLFDFLNNQALIGNLPSVPKPVYERPTDLEEFTPDQHLREIGRSESAVNKAVIQNVANPQYALQSSRAQSLGAQNRAIDAVRRANVDVRGREAMLNQRVQMRNVMRGNQHMRDILERDIAIRNLKGENITNLSNNIVNIMSDRERWTMWKNYFNNFGGAGKAIVNRNYNSN